MRERDVEQRLVRKIKNMGGCAYKWVSPGNNGVPDRIVVLPGRAPIFVELKTDTGRLSPVQIVQIDRLMQLGQDVRVLHGCSEVDDFIEAMREEEREVRR